MSQPHANLFKDSLEKLWDTGISTLNTKYWFEEFAIVALDSKPWGNFNKTNRIKC
jgi:hypothetical protein